MPRATAFSVALATSAGVADLSGQPGLGHLANVAGAAADDLNAVAAKNVDGSAAHVPGQHDRYAHAGELRDDVRLTTATRRRRQSLFRRNLVVLNREDREGLTMAEVFVDLGAA